MATNQNNGSRMGAIDTPVAAGALVIIALFLLIVINQLGLSVNVGVKVG
jgi:hypothetical protein